MAMLGKKSVADEVISSRTCLTLVDRIRGALYGLLIADALAAPTHWYYGS